MKSLLLGLLVLLVSFNAFSLAARYVIPADEDVITEYNVDVSEQVLYPFNFNLLVWNIYKGDKRAFKREFFKYMAEKELVLLQEGYIDASFLEVMKLQSSFYFMMATAWMDRKRNLARSGVINAGLVKPNWSLWQRSRYREPLVQTPKMTLFTKYQLAGTDLELLVANIHAINFVSTGKFIHMLDQAAEIIDQHQGPVVFGGDFNTHLKGRYNFMIRKLKEIGMELVQFKVDQRMRVLGKYLDYVWIKDLQVNEANAPKSPGSDHNPMLVNLSLF